jgi:transposase
MSTKQKNNYPLEFKVSSAQLAIDSEQSIAKTARDLGINHNTLHGWIDKYSDSRDSNQIGQKNMSNNKAACFEENKLLKKELALVKQERDLLKKAAAYFAKASQ